MQEKRASVEGDILTLVVDNQRFPPSDKFLLPGDKAGELWLN
ncbi:MAG: hypothetical protein AB7P18_09640 [Candidatus Binatia bacterium]